MPARTVGPEPGEQFGRIPAGSSLTLNQFGEYVSGLGSVFDGPGAPLLKCIDCIFPAWVNSGPFFANSGEFLLEADFSPYFITVNGGTRARWQNQANTFVLDMSSTAFRNYFFNTWLPTVYLNHHGPNFLHGIPIDAAHPTIWTCDGWQSNYSAIQGGTIDPAFPQTRAAYYAAIDGFFAYANANCPEVRMCPHLSSMEDPSRATFELIYGNCPALMKEPFQINQLGNRTQLYHQLDNLYWFANEASAPLVVNDPPSRIILFGCWADNGDYHSAFAMYCMARGANTFFDLLVNTTSGQHPVNPSVWLPTSEWLGPGTSAMTPVVGAGGSSLLMRTFAGGIAYFNFTGSTQHVTLPAGFTDWQGNPVSTASIQDGKGDVFLAPISGKVPGSGGGGGGTGGGTGGGPPPPDPPPVASATNTCCITITAVPEIPDTPGTPNLYLALIGTADVTGTALTLAEIMSDTIRPIGLDSPDFAFLNSPIMIYGAGLGGIPFWTTIAAITDSLHATLADAVPTNVTAKEVDCYFPIIQDPTATLFKYYARNGTYDMHSSLSTRPTLNFEIFSYPVHNSGQVYVPQAGMPALLILENYGDLFGGSIDQVQAENTPGKLPVTSKCQCVSWDQVLTKRLLMLTGAFPTGTNRDVFTGDGTKAIFNLSSPPVGIVSVTLDGVPQTFAINSTLAYLSWNVDNHIVTVFGTPPAAGAILAVTYQAAGVTIAPPGYLNQTADQIFFALIQSIALAEGLTAIAVPGPLVDQIQFTSQDTVDSALQSLMSYISDGSVNYWHWVSPRKVVHFDVQGVTQVAPWNIDVEDLSDANVLMQVSLTTTREKFANACWADIGAAKGLSTLTQTFPGDGTSRSFQTQFPISSIISLTKIIDNTITQTLTNIPQEGLVTGQVPTNPGDAWYFNLNQNSLTEDPANPTMPASTGGNTYLLQVVYTPSAAIVEQFSNVASFAARHQIEGGSGETDLYVNLGNTNAVLANATIAQNEATYYAQMTKKLDIATYRGGLQSGMGIPVNLPNIGAVGLFIVDVVRLIDENGRWKWSVQCSAGAIVGDWKKAMVRLANLL